MKALAKIEALTGDAECTRAIERGVDYYVRNLFDEHGVPKPFCEAAPAHRLPPGAVRLRRVHQSRQCCSGADFEKLDRLVDGVVNQILTVWQKPDGSFRSRQLLLGWDNVPMHRWAQSQLFRSLCLLLLRSGQQSLRA